jgi:hypothetical protein
VRQDAYILDNGRREDTSWVLWARDPSGFVSRSGTPTDLKNVSNPRNLQD